MDARTKLRNRTADHSTPTLVTTLQELERKFTLGNLGREEDLVRITIIDVLEDRYPAASAVLDAAVDACPDDKDFDYVAVLLAAIPETEKQ